ncbi:hypothetical protein DCC81_03725 [Chitinophaga parva]|uniref:Uncharacterized protein n=1 Tax=Chitinophaga parva TaxID=2169414 RepID=A0A2T7BLP6_9BACT|nr:hypothetical protein [Chitinophaga parva]PUZ28603.1 hypothetical protein DCC81_03725 [Chitinophaga parva]
MKGRIKILAVLFCMAVGVPAVLNGLSSWKTRVSGAFLRAYPPHLLTAGRSINLGVNSYYIAGASGPYLLLGNYTNPRVALRVRTGVMDTMAVALAFPAGKAPSLASRLSVAGPSAFVTDGLQGAVYQADAGQLQFATSGSLSAYGFNQAAVFDGTHIGLRRYDPLRHQNILSLYGPGRGQVTDHAELLTKQVDGVFCTEGKLLHSTDPAVFIYVYLFRNQYLVMDSSLSLLSRGHTIDTNSVAKIKVQTYADSTRSQLAAPPVVVNRLAAAAQNHLLIASEVLADNDPDQVLDGAAIVDVYELGKGYRESFYLSKQGHKRLSDMSIYNGVLYAVIDQYLYSYALAPTVLANK